MSQLIFSIERSPESTVERLRKAGFLHVTGLHVKCPAGEYIIGEKMYCRESGRWDYNNGLFVINTENREVWVRKCSETEFENIEKTFSEIQLQTIAPNGRGAFVPFSNGESIEPSHILKRIADTYSGMSYFFTQGRAFVARGFDLNDLGILATDSPSPNTTNIIIDMSEVDLDDEILGVLVKIRNRYIRRRGKFILFGLSSSNRETIEISLNSNLLELCKTTEKQALEFVLEEVSNVE